jgi:hypothetical protein
LKALIFVAAAALYRPTAAGLAVHNEPLKVFL